MADEWANNRLQKRVDDGICAACRKPIEPGNRIQACYICLDPKARNPNQITEKGMELGTDCEWAHIRCEDPYLDGRRIITP
jgi:hypothetical protein